MSHRKRIMLVDDDADFVSTMRLVLEKSGYDVLVAYNGKECLDLLRYETADAIVLDVMMTTRTEGFDVAREIRNSEYTKNIPLLMVTSVNSTVPFKFEPDETWLPVDALIEKPIEPERLLEEISKMVNNPKKPQTQAEAPLILLVDDDPDFLKMNSHILERKGYRVLCAPDPKTALEKMQQSPPHLVVTDLMMTSLDSGFSFARQIKQDARFKNVPVIIVTAVGSQRGFDLRPRTEADLAAMCADAWFDKPVAPAALLQKVEELLKRNPKEVSI